MSIRENEKEILNMLAYPSKIHASGWHHKIEIGEGVEKQYQWDLEH